MYCVLIRINLIKMEDVATELVPGQPKFSKEVETQEDLLPEHKETWRQFLNAEPP